VDREGKVIASRLFEDRQNFDKVEAPVAVAAFNEAFDHIAKEMIAWTVAAL
jgi:phospholipid/cholesterol/gamma-HCH transport system substrate-binding protein